ncbi:hypothetical protein SGUI_2058 [Serinicoccus hydrothermalis]|uniref:Uncharacterized protein n=1 Tax=Serinicoccus hydrothermalis TaxID=1758689 RepID=A0A1B1NDG8_9MICO|nr:hypothetical protein [Serinicoccus hydrothermalis]ANS79454.1 hypothetical protein SGUI_2058 [Serinicoccus hydrothermalis]
MIGVLGAVLPLALLGAVSPLIFLTVGTLLSSRGPAAALRYALGNAVVLVLAVALGAGLLGRGLTALLERELASRLVDGVLGLVLLAYAVVQARGVERHARTAQPAAGAAGARRGDPFVLGLTAMATNLTTLPLMLSAGQRLGTARLPLVESLPVLLLIVLVGLAPAWLPFLLRRVAPRRPRKAPERHTSHRFGSVGAWLPVLACVLGAALLLGRALDLTS